MAIIEHETSIQQDLKPAHVDEVGQVLLDAATRIRKHGWCQGTMFDDGRTCALGALSMVTRSTSLWMDAAERLAHSVGLNPKSVGVGFWNDRPERTKEQVVEAFERAAWGV